MMRSWMMMGVLLVASAAVIGCGKDGGDTGHDDHTDGGTTDGGTTDGGTGNTDGGTTDGGTTDGGTTDGGTTSGEPDCEDGVNCDDLDNDGDGRVDEGMWVGGELVISEVMANPEAVNDLDGEWFEVTNVTKQTLRIDGLAITTDLYGDSYVIEGELSIAPSQQMVFAVSDADNGGINPDHVYSELSLNSDSDGLTLHMGDTQVDAVLWSADWPDQIGASLSLDPFFLDADANDAPESWCISDATWVEGGDRGTPGTDNALCPLVDHDGDGFTGEDGDCEDEDPAVHPEAEELCGDGVDNDCDDDPSDCGLGGTYLLELEHTGRVLGESSGDYLGWSLDYAGDVNGDGLGDMIVGAPYEDEAASSAGAAYVLYGPVVGELSLDDADKLTGVNSSDDAGYKVAGDLDYDGDGYGDLIVAAHENDTLNSSGGAVYVVSGGPAGAPGGSLAGATATLFGQAGGDSLGYYGATPAGDVNGDGYDDVIAGSIYYSDKTVSNAGAAYLVYGPAAFDGSVEDAEARMYGFGGGNYAGVVSGAGDVNGDGYDDVMIGAYGTDLTGGGPGTTSDEGVTYLMMGPLSGIYDLDGSQVSYTGEARSDYSGLSIASAGDMNSDGYDDLLIGAYGVDAGGDDKGAVYVVLGSAEPASASLADAYGLLVGERNDDQLGRTAPAAGDVDGDGDQDLVIGAYYQDPDNRSNAGTAYLVYGPFEGGTVSLDRADAFFAGGYNNDYVGVSVSAGDMDRDGYDDLLIGAYGVDTRDSDVGAAFIVNGAPGF